MMNEQPADVNDCFLTDSCVCVGGRERVNLLCVLIILHGTGTSSDLARRPALPLDLVCLTNTNMDVIVTVDEGHFLNLE